MYLKSLELFGFKSFAPKTVLNFHRGVTAIVGPNGCGKSNVLDAIRWVLGEQSAKALRGGEMADVIFNGTDSRQPVGLAEVSLTFADCEKDLGVEWNEVRLTRRVFRDGKSEYLLNKTPCRLKDIHQMFMDTGIGRTAYSIMEQGKIDQILSSRPEDRRAVFEEAAGITKYKTQKKEALRKLEYTEANLIRITDIVKEVKRQIGSLQRQAGKARRYQALLHDLRVLETSLGKRNFDALDNQLEGVLASIAQMREQHTTQAQSIESRESSLHGQRHEIDQVEQQISAARQQVQELRNQITASESRIAFNNERIAEFAVLQERYARDIAAGEEKLHVQENQILETDSQLEQLVLNLQGEESRLEEETARTAAMRARRIEVQQQLQTAQRLSNETESAIIRSRAELTAALGQREAGEVRLNQIQEDLRRAEESRDRLAALAAENNSQVENGRASLVRQQEELRRAENALADARTLLQENSSALGLAQRLLAEKASKLEVLLQLNAEGEGFNEGTQAVLRGLDNPEFFKPAILGALATQITVQPEFIPAIEAALGQTLQAIVVKDATVAESMLKTLTGQKLGRASLTTPEWIPRSSSTQIEALPEGAVCWALDRIEIPSTLSPLLHQLLGQCVIAPSLEVALQIRRHNSRLAIATLTGEVITSEGIIHGGQTGEAGTSVLQRKIQINGLESEEAIHREEVERLEASVTDFGSRVDSFTDLVRSLRDEMQIAQMALSTLEGQQSVLQRDLRETEGKRETLDWERVSLTENLQAAVGKFSDLESGIASWQQTLEESNEHMRQLQSESTELQHQEESLTAALNDLRVAVATNRQRRDNLQRERQPMSARVQELAELIAQRKQDIETYTARTESLETESYELTQRIETLNTQVYESEAQAAQVVESRTTLVNALQEVENELRDARRELTRIQDLRGQQEILQSQLTMRLEHLSEHMQHRYQIDIRTFSPDSYAFHCAIREQRKLRQRRATGTPEPALEEAVSTANEVELHGAEATEPAEVEEVTVEEIVGSTPEHEAVDWEFVEMLVREMSEKLDSMGPINMDAIQEYDELEERHRFLEEQYNDLTNSKSELLDVISKINTTTRQLFADTFEQVRINFQEMFVELFGEGAKANLILSDDADPLECGIEIIAKPPGKQLQSISLLSGGEKTMTAVALLFSIYMVKPSPFCVLDEMDAPLDESNINRFIKILDRFVGQSQFVVITHNKRTIAKADVLYGVTMEEHGVSKLVGVKLTRREEATQDKDFADAGSEESPQPPSIAETFGKKGNLHSEDKAGAASTN